VGLTAHARALLAPLAVAAAACVAVAAAPSLGARAEHAAPELAARYSTERPVGPAINSFGIDLMRKLEGGNIVVSPDSIATALAFAGSGARGPTAAQMARVLRLASPREFARVGRLQRTIAAAQRAAAGTSTAAPTLEIANGLFVQQGLDLRQSFLASARAAFGARPKPVNFGDSSGAAKKINEWVSAHTHALIRELFASLSPEARLVLANAMYLKAAWQDPFAPSATTTALFHGARRSAAMKLMHETEQLPYARGNGYEAVELPYRASRLSLLVVLPVGQSIAALQRRLGATTIAGIVRRLTPEPVRLTLPRFQLAIRAALNGPLGRLGMHDAFGPGANFSGIAGGEPLRIGLVEHAATFSIDESGTLASAATGVELAPEVVRLFDRVIEFDADRPFLFFLRDASTGTVLFAGRLSEPAA